MRYYLKNKNNLVNKKFFIVFNKITIYKWNDNVKLIYTNNKLNLNPNKNILRMKMYNFENKMISNLIPLILKDVNIFIYFIFI